MHQLWTCEATSKARIELGLDDLVAWGRHCGFRPRVTWECGTPHVPDIPQSDAMKAPLNVGIVEGNQGGQWAYADGSLIDPDAAETARGG